MCCEPEEGLCGLAEPLPPLWPADQCQCQYPGRDCLQGAGEIPNTALMSLVQCQCPEQDYLPKIALLMDVQLQKDQLSDGQGCCTWLHSCLQGQTVCLISGLVRDHVQVQ